MISATSIASIAVFMAALWALGVVRAAAGVLETARSAVRAMRDETLDDEAREKAVQRASIRLLGAFASILVRGALSLAAGFLPIWLASATGLATVGSVTGYLARWDVIAVATVAILAGHLAQRRVWPSR